MRPLQTREDVVEGMFVSLSERTPTSYTALNLFVRSAGHERSYPKERFNASVSLGVHTHRRGDRRRLER